MSAAGYGIDSVDDLTRDGTFDSDHRPIVFEGVVYI